MGNCISSGNVVARYFDNDVTSMGCRTAPAMIPASVVGKEEVASFVVASRG